MNEVNTDWKINKLVLHEQKSIQTEEYSLEKLKYFFSIDKEENQSLFLYTNYSTTLKQYHLSIIFCIKNQNEEKNYILELSFPIKSDGKKKTRIPLLLNDLLNTENGWIHEDNSIWFSIKINLVNFSHSDQTFKTIDHNLHRISVEGVYSISPVHTNIKDRYSSGFIFDKNEDIDFVLRGKQNLEKKIEVEFIFSNLNRSQSYSIYILLQNIENSKSKPKYETVDFSPSNLTHSFVFDVNESELNESNGWLFKQTVQFQFKVANFEFNDFPEKVKFIIHSPDNYLGGKNRQNMMSSLSNELHGHDIGTLLNFFHNRNDTASKKRSSALNKSFNPPFHNNLEHDLNSMQNDNILNKMDNDDKDDLDNALINDNPFQNMHSSHLNHHLHHHHQILNNHALNDNFFNDICNNDNDNHYHDFLNDISNHHHFHNVNNNNSTMNDEIAKLIESTNRESSAKNDSDLGLAGLQNQGATCYLNSAIQLLFHIPAFRRIVYQINIKIDDEKGNSKNDRIAFNLQRLFIEMQTNKHGVCSTNNLTKSFGWSANDLITEQDVQEFIRSLIDNLETQLKGTPIDGEIAKIFRGASRTVVEAPQVGYTGSKAEYFYDLPLDVRGSASLEESLKNYLKPEHLTGNNMYHVDGKGPQEAEMHIEFVSFPSVLQIHLKRFEYDFTKRMQCKINDRFEFPPQLDLSRYISNDEAAKDEQPKIYDLYCILVHEGFAQIGHYYAFIRQILDVDENGNSKINDDLNSWFKFNDSFVTKSSYEEAVTNNYGGSYNNSNSYGNIQGDKFFSAYMLVYVRRDEIMKLMEPVTDKDIPQHLQEYIKELKDKEENERIKNNQFVFGSYMGGFDDVGYHHQFSNSGSIENIEDGEDELIDVTLMTEEAYFANFTKDIYELQLKEKKKVIQVPSKASIEKIYSIVEDAFQVEKGTIRLWEAMSECKPYKPFYRIIFHPIQSNLFVQKKEKNDELKISKPFSLTAFVIFFDISLDVPAQYIGSTRIKKGGPVSSVFKFASSVLGFPENTEYLAFKELGGATPFSEISNDYNLKEKGVIIILQLKNPSVLSQTSYQWKTKQYFIDTLEKDNLSDELLNVPFYNILEESKSKLIDATSYFLAVRRYIYVDIYSFKKLDKPLLRIKYSTAFNIQDLANLVAEKLSLDYDKSRDSVLLYNTYDDLSKVSTSFMTSFKDISIKKECRFFFQEVKGLNFEQVQKAKYIRTLIALDGFNVSQQARVYLEEDNQVPSILSSLITDETLTDAIIRNDDVDDEIDDDFFKAFTWMQEEKVRVCQVENHSITKILGSEDNLPNNIYEVVIEVIPDSQRKLSKTQFLTTCVHRHPVGTCKMNCLDPFCFVIDTEERVLELKERLMSTIQMDDKWENCVLYLGKTEMKNDMVKIQYIIDANSRPKLTIYHKNQQKKMI